MHQIHVCLGSAPDPAGGAYSAPRDPLAVFKEHTSKGKEKGRERKVKGRGGGRRDLAHPTILAWSPCGLGPHKALIQP